MRRRLCALRDNSARLGPGDCGPAGAAHLCEGAGGRCEQSGRGPSRAEDGSFLGNFVATVATVIIVDLAATTVCTLGCGTRKLVTGYAPGRHRRA